MLKGKEVREIGLLRRPQGRFHLPDPMMAGQHRQVRALSAWRSLLGGLGTGRGHGGLSEEGGGW